MISSELVFVQLSQFDGFVGVVELAMMLEASVSQVRKLLQDLGDLVESNDRDEWRVIRNITPERILSASERAERDRLEQTVEQSFFVLGSALKILRDRRLYRETHSSFKDYVRDRFDFTRAAAYYLINASEVVENLRCQQIVDTNKSTILPTKESQCRELGGYPPEIQRQAWKRAVELAGGNKVPSARLVKRAVREITQTEDVEPKLFSETKLSLAPSFREVNYQPGIGVEYTVKLDEETYNRLQRYQDKIKSATKCGAIARLLDAIVESE